jgi:FkbM family methyltransferase
MKLSLKSLRKVFYGSKVYKIAYNLRRFRVFDGFPRISWSQCAEDIVLETIIGDKQDGFYLDLGAHDPTTISVTKLFYDKGWTGINVEANPHKFNELVEFRVRDINVNAVVGREESYAFSVMSSSAMSTADPKTLERLVSEGKISEVTRLQIKGVTLRSLLTEYSRTKVDFLNIDLEGMDFEALKSGKFEELDIQRYPQYVCLESYMPLSRTLELDSVRYLQALGYEILCVLPHSTILKLVF